METGRWRSGARGSMVVREMEEWQLCMGSGGRVGRVERGDGGVAVVVGEWKKRW